VAHVLTVATLEVGHPVALAILMEANDRSLHPAPGEVGLPSAQ
jgi:hypothetical protein